MGCKFTVQITVERHPVLEVGCTITAPGELAVMHAERPKQAADQKMRPFLSLAGGVTSI